jgi:hypothetical protein
MADDSSEPNLLRSDIHSAHPQRRSAVKEYAVARIHISGVAMRHGGLRDATLVPLSILTLAV